MFESVCGIVGFWGSPGACREETANAMAGELRHRGPDNSGVWVDEPAGLALGHARLAILDLSEQGRQPMVSECGRYVISLNGEIYNFQELREEAQSFGHVFRGHSDTEAALALISRIGLVKAVGRFHGMFAFALWDREQRRLYLVRDRFGEKPLYYCRAGKTFIFGSELKALKAHPDFRAEIDRTALSQYFRYGYIPAPRTIYSSVFKLLPGTFLELSSSAGEKTPPAQSYWSITDVARQGLENPFTGTPREAADELEALVKRAVGSCMVSDVPLGAFLSGGVDSSLVAAMMQAQSRRPIDTFTIGFGESDYDESTEARAVAKHLGTNHHELAVTPAQARDVIPALPSIYDEPFSDSSQIPTCLVSRFARKTVTVCLSGDGGDEIFGGYNRYLWAPRFARNMAWIPQAARAAAGHLASRIPPMKWDSLFAGLGAVLPAGTVPRNPGDKIHKIAKILDFKDKTDIYSRLVSNWAVSPVLETPPAPHAEIEAGALSGAGDFISWMFLNDQARYLPDDILVKLDRAGMSVSLETRVPFLDHRLAEFSWRVPARYKVGRGGARRLQKEILGRYVPPALFERPKAGFGVPIHSWLRGPLRDWAEDLLDESRLRGEGFLSSAPIREKWAEHLAGRFNWQHQLWSVLMFESWLVRNR